MADNGSKVYSWLWVLAAVYLAANLIVGLGVSSVLTNIGSVLITLVLFAFVLLYGAVRYGWKRVLILFGITFVISWSMESLSILTGFPFGDYFYTLTPKLGAVPYIVMPAYFGNGFLAWTISHILLNSLSPGMTGRNLFQVPVIAAFVMVMWDFCMDPVTSTIDQDWIWLNGGHYFGVPVRNYFGWYLTVYLIFQSFALYLNWSEKGNDSVEPPATPLPKSYWFLAPVMFIGTAILTLVHPLVLTNNLDIYWSMFLAAVMTMIFVSVLAIIFVCRFEQ